MVYATTWSRDDIIHAMKAAHYKCSLNDTDVSGVKIAEIKSIKAKDTYDCEVLVWSNKEAFHEEYFKRFPDLKMFVLWGTDDDLIDESLFAKNNVIVKKNNFYATEALAEYILAFYIAKMQHRDWQAYVIRHGETEWNSKGILQGRKNSPLSQKGRGHAKKMADHLKKSGIKRIYVSPLGRAQETAAVIAKKIGASVTVVPEFAEMHFGAFEGKDKRQIEDLFADFFEQRKKSTSHKLLVPYPAGESYYDVYLRVLQPLLRIIAKAEPFIIVGHESVNRMLKGIMLEQELEQMVGSRQKNNEIIKVNIAQSSEQVTTL